MARIKGRMSKVCIKGADPNTTFTEVSALALDC